MLGIQLDRRTTSSTCRCSATDPYGKFIPGANGFAQLIVGVGADGIPNTADDVVVEGNPARQSTRSARRRALRTGHAFLDDIAHSANPVQRQTGALARRPTPTTPDRADYAEPARHLRQRAARPALHHRRRPRQREHRPDRRPPRLPLRAQPPGRRDQGDDSGHRRSPPSSPQWQLVAWRVGRRAPVPGGALRHRDAVSAPRVRGVRAQGAAATSTRSLPQTATTPRSIRRSSPSSRTRSTASATRC